MQAIGACSAISVGLVTHGQTLGIITFICARSGRHYDQADLVTAQDLARRCAMALNNARLFEQTRAAVAAREDFISVASHELKTPLTPLQLHLNTLQRRIGEFTKEGKEEWLQKRLRSLHRQSERLNHLVEELLDVSRIVAGRLRLEPESVDLAAVVQAVADDVRRTEQGRGFGARPHRRDRAGRRRGRRILGSHSDRAGGHESAVERAEVRRW